MRMTLFVLAERKAGVVVAGMPLRVVPRVCKLSWGALVPMPTEPLALIVRTLVIDPPILAAGPKLRTLSEAPIAISPAACLKRMLGTV